MKTAIVSVINDLSTDQRVHKVCLSLSRMGYQVTLVGRRQRKSLPLSERPYSTKRMFLLFEKGPLFYAAFQLRLFFFLLFRRADVLVANDLDTLLPNYLNAVLKGAALVYDSHEIFCEVPELKDNPVKRKIWKSVERLIFPKLRYIFTVNDSIAAIYRKEYGKEIIVLRNVPFLKENTGRSSSGRKELGLPEGKRIIVLQGAGINVDRGAEEAVEAMQWVENAILLIIGSGDVIGLLKEMSQQLKLQEKVRFIGKVPFEKLMQYTALADLGLSLDKDTNINYRYSLPNKVFDYLHAGVPVLCSNLVEVRKVVDAWQAGTWIESHDPRHIAEKINEIFSDPEKLQNWKKNTKIAAANLNWETEEQQLISVYRQFL